VADPSPVAALAAVNGPLPFNVTLKYAQDLLQEAIMVEHSTIPLYLTALYSIPKSDVHSKNGSTYAAETIHSVVVEEMLHMTIAANVLNAVGGEPLIDSPHFVPKFPLQLPLTNVSVGIRAFDMLSIQNFMLVESTTALAKSIGEAYEYVLSLLKALCEEYGEANVFTGNYSHQLHAEAMGETAPKVGSLRDAAKALLGVSEQGGGCPVPGKEQLWPNVSNISAGPLGGHLSHFARFSEVAAGRRYRSNDTADGGPTGERIDTNWTAVYSFRPNPKIADFPEGSIARNMTLAFASTYTSLLVKLHNVFNGAPETYDATIGSMMELATMAKTLMTTPDPNENTNGVGVGYGIGPTWEYMHTASLFDARNGKARPIIPITMDPKGSPCPLFRGNSKR